MTSPISFYKFQGAGNDFVFFDATKNAAIAIKLKEHISKICDRHFGVGADGLVMITHFANEEMTWDFFNSDGSRAEMCGNAARCAFLMAEQMGYDKKHIYLNTDAGRVPLTRIDKHKIKVEMNSSALDPVSKQILGISGFHLNTGVPHFVFKSDAPFREQQEVCAQIRNHSSWAGPGTNVTLIDGFAPSVKAITYERGVENFTLACGTGAMAAAIVAGVSSGVTKVNVEMPGGEFTVEFDLKSKKVMLTGDAKPIYHGQLMMELI